jgi:aminomethyltransferase
MTTSSAPSTSLPSYPTGVRDSPYLEFAAAEGAVAAAFYNGMWLPTDFGRDPRVEYAALMNGVVLWDVGCERVLELAGRDAVALADLLLTRDIAATAVGRCRHALACFEDGTILCENLVMRLNDTHVWICHGPGDLPTWARAAVMHAGFDVQVGEAAVSPLALQGPVALDVMESLAPGVARLERFHWDWTTIAGEEVLVSRTGWSGEFGYEVFASDWEPAKRVWRAVRAAADPFGVMVTGVNGTRAWENGISDIHYGDNLGLTPLDAGLMRSVDLEKIPAFIGAEQLKRQRDSGVTRAPVAMVIEGDDLPVHREFWPVTRPGGGETVGSTWQVFYSYAVEQHAANAIVNAGIAPGDRLEVVTPDGARACVVLRRPIAPAGHG